MSSGIVAELWNPTCRSFVPRIVLFAVWKRIEETECSHKGIKALRKRYTWHICSKRSEYWKAFSKRLWHQQNGKQLKQNTVSNQWTRSLRKTMWPKSNSKSLKPLNSGVKTSNFLTRADLKITPTTIPKSVGTQTYTNLIRMILSSLKLLSHQLSNPDQVSFQSKVLKSSL